MQATRSKWIVPCALVTALLEVGNLTADVIQQRPDDNYVAFEAEEFEELIGDETTGFIVVDVTGTLITPFGSQVLPAGSNASGGAALFDQEGGSNLSSTATWLLEFQQPGRYWLYVHYSMFEMRRDTDYGNEDSFFAPLAFDEFPDTTGRSDLEDLDAVPGDGTWEGTFRWQQATWEDDSFASYEVPPANVGRVLEFAVSTRERGTALDALILSQQDKLTGEQLDRLLLGGPAVRGDFTNDGLLDAADIDLLTTQVRRGANPAQFDLNADARVNHEDRRIWVEELRKTWFGDANLDGEFSSADLVQVFQTGEYEDTTDGNSTWGDGDWNGDGDFDSGDFVQAFQGGGFEQGPLAAVAFVPEPATLAWCAMAIVVLCREKGTGPFYDSRSVR